MKGYLGETILDIHKTEFAMYSRQDWVMLWIELYGTISGVQHKEWLIDQIVMILKGSKVVVKVAKWDNGHEEKRFSLAGETPEYHKWVDEMGDWSHGRTC